MTKKEKILYLACILAILLALAFAPVFASNADDYEEAQKIFKMVGDKMNPVMDSLTQDQQYLIYSLYYIGGSDLETMRVSMLLIKNHGKDRQAEFDEALREFREAMMALLTELNKYERN